MTDRRAPNDEFARATATLYTMASIFDVGERLLRYSQELRQRQVARRIVARRFPRVRP